MVICTHFHSEMARLKETPLAVSFGWMLLGILLLVSFDSMLVALAALGLIAYNGYRLTRGAGAIACCMKRRAHALKNGKSDGGSCLIG